jgi:AcrR family transcriptional regulator
MGFVPVSTREKVFVAGISVFAKKGFKGATVREICKLAGSANMNAVNYYFGGKAKLYRAILEMMFAELGNRMRSLGSTDETLDPRRRLCDLIRAYCAMLFTGGEMGSNILAIFNNEMAQPTSYLDELIDAHMVPQNRDILSLMREIMGDDAPRWLLQDCAVSVFSQVMYYSTTWVIYRRLNPEHPGMEACHEHLAEHVCRFSLAGIDEMKRAFEAGESRAPF